METRGRKKVVRETAPPTRDPQKAKTEPNILDDESVDINPFGGGNPRYVNRLYQPWRNDHAVDRDDRYSDNPIRGQGLKIEIPEFTGKLKVKLIAIKLRQHASLWWDHVNKRRQIEGKLKVINEFDKLRMRCDVVEEEEQVVVRFLGVLKPKIADIVSLQPYWTYTDVCRLALKVEKQIKAKSKGSTSRFTSRFTPPTRTAPPTAPKTTPKATTPTTSAVGNTRERVDNAPHCYKCGGLRHYTRDCPNLKTLAFVPDDAGPVYDTNSEPELDELDSTILNKPAYQMNLKEFAELQRQVTELLEKGLIRESMSPCAVPALLVPKHGGTFRMCIDSRAMNKITIKFGCDLEMNGRQLSKLEMDCTSGCSLEQHLSHLRQLFSVLRAQKLYANGKKCHFLVTEVMFLGYIVTGSGIKMDPTKVEAIISWPTPSTIHDIRSFHGLASFYQCFIQNFSSIIVPLTECVKGGRVGIGSVLSQNQRPYAFFNEKLNDPRRKYSTYDKEFYAIVRSLDTWRHYLLSNEFVLFSDHEALKFRMMRDAMYTVSPWEDVSLDFVFRSVNRTTGKSPFEVVYGWNPITPLDLVPVPKVGQLSEEGADS
ncbi:reverse transcriptase domain-containing protein [Tanacetum coccineum]